MTDTILSPEAFRLKGRLYTLTVLSVIDPNISNFEEQLKSTVAQAPKMFQQTPIVIDCSEINGKIYNLDQLCECIRRYELIPVAVQGGPDPRIHQAAQALGLAVLNGSSMNDKPLTTESREKNAPKSRNTSKAKLITTPVRSGQQVFNKGDLVITAAVSHGAELLADGHIHVYGPLRGRVLAGIDGNQAARIFCQSLEAELVSIAGYYRLRDALDDVQGPCQIYLKNDSIHIEPI